MSERICVRCGEDGNTAVKDGLCDEHYEERVIMWWEESYLDRHEPEDDENAEVTDAF